MVPNAKSSAEELQSFAQANSPERAAAPKEVILVEKMPLTDVGKPAKVQLRLDAAKRAFSEALVDVANGAVVVVEMVADPKSGYRAVIRIADVSAIARQDVENRVQEKMRYYSTPYDISWQGAP